MARNRYVVRVELLSWPGALSYPYRNLRFVYARGSAEPIAAFTRSKDAREFRDALNKGRPVTRERGSR